MTYPDGDALIPERLDLANADPMVRSGRLVIEGGRWWTAQGTARFGTEAGNTE